MMESILEENRQLRERLGLEAEAVSNLEFKSHGSDSGCELDSRMPVSNVLTPKKGCFRF